jgi:hypothetical protein
MSPDVSIFLAKDLDGQLVIPASIGQQVFVITTGVAGGLAGLILATRLTTATHMKLSPVLLASAVATAATFGVVFLMTEGKMSQAR